MEPPVKKATFMSARVVEEQSTVAVPPKVLAKFNTVLAQKFYDTSKGGFTAGEGLVIKYRFIQFTEGTRFWRWVWGGIGNAGEASLTLKVDFFDPAATQLGTIQVEGRIGSGFFGGSVDDALDKASDQIVNYAIANFRQRQAELFRNGRTSPEGALREGYVHSSAMNASATCIVWRSRRGRTARSIERVPARRQPGTLGREDALS